MNFKIAESFATVSNVNISFCNFTIAFWIRLDFIGWFKIDLIRGSSTRGKIIFISYYKISKVAGNFFVFTIELEVSRSIMSIWSVNIPYDKGKNWNHFAVTSQQCDKVKTYLNGKLCPLRTGIPPRFPDYRCTEFRSHKTPVSRPSISRPPKKTFIFGSQSRRRFYSRTLGSIAIMQELHILGFALPPSEIYNLHKGQQAVKMNYSFCP